MELGWGRAKLDMLILIRIPFSFHVIQYTCTCPSSVKIAFFSSSDLWTAYVCEIDRSVGDVL